MYSICTHRNAQTETHSDLRLASLASFDLLNHIQALRSQSAHVNIAWNTIQDTNYVLPPAKLYKAQIACVSSTVK